METAVNEYGSDFVYTEKVSSVCQNITEMPDGTMRYCIVGYVFNDLDSDGDLGLVENVDVIDGGYADTLLEYFTPAAVFMLFSAQRAQDAGLSWGDAEFIALRASELHACVHGHDYAE